MRGNNKKKKKCFPHVHSISRRISLRGGAQYFYDCRPTVSLSGNAVRRSRGERRKDGQKGREKERKRILANLPHPRIAPNLYKYRRGERVHLSAYKQPSTEQEREKVGSVWWVWASKKKMILLSISTVLNCCFSYFVPR